MIEEMTALGFTASEARVYVALLKRPEATGYELAKEAGLQRANVYAALESLTTRDCVTRIAAAGAPVRFLAVPPADVLGRIKRSTSRRADALIADLARVAPAPAATSFYTLHSIESIIDRVATLADSSRQRIGVCAWSEDMAWLAGPLRAAAASGCQVVVNVFGETDLDFGDVYQHESPDRTVAGHVLTMVCDSATAVIANLGPHPTALCTDQPAVVQVVEKLIRDEAYLAALYATHHTQLEEAYGPHLVQLRRRLLPADQADNLVSIVGFGATDLDRDPFRRDS